MNSQTTNLLVSVRSAEEARAALDGGADVIDVKEPSRGSLGAASPATIVSVIEEVDGAALVTAACGELTEYQAGTPLLKGLYAAKIGMAGTSSLTENERNALWANALTDFGLSHRVAVAYADYQASKSPSPELVVRAGAALGCRFFLIDTFDKSLSLCDLVAKDTAFSEEIDCSLKLATSHHMRLVIAGSVRQQDLRGVVSRWSPDYIAVRGAACDGSRNGPVSTSKVRGLKSELLDLKNSVAVRANFICEDKAS